MRTADPVKSDPDLAGLWLRCGDGAFEVLVVLLEPFPVRAKPQVTIVAQPRNIVFQATVAAPGTALLLPHEASVLAGSHWRRLNELSITVDEGGRRIVGRVPLTGLDDALDALRRNCIAR